jgi:predicted ATPase
VITKVVIENFKRFEHEVFDLEDTIVLAGPNNSGKSTLLQALATWHFALKSWRLGRGARGGAKQRTGTAVTRKDFTAMPLREFDLLWNRRLTGKRKEEREEGEKPGEPRLIHVTVHGKNGDGNGGDWSLTMELRYSGKEQIYVKPVPSEEDVPPQAQALAIVHCPPFSGIGSDERRMDRGAQDFEVGRGKPGDILRNLLYEVAQEEANWEPLVRDLGDLFNVELLRPIYDDALTPFIRCEYLDRAGQSGGRRGPELDIASGGSGLLQVLLLLSYFHARPASVLLLDEPDAHLHVILQRQVYDRLREVALRRRCQLVVATHSEVILDGTPPARVISFLGAPHRLVRDDQRDQVREAMKRLTTLDLLLAEQGKAVLYCEGESDLKVLTALAKVASHPAREFLAEPFFHGNEGRNPREAREHLFALRAIRPDLRGLLVLDGDNRGLDDHELRGEGLTILRWKRYEIENYLLIPEAIRRFLTTDGDDLFSVTSANAAMEYLRGQLPPQTFADPLVDNATVLAVRASKDVLPQLFEAAGRPMEKPDFFLIAEAMRKEEIHQDVLRVLDAVASLRTIAE